MRRVGRVFVARRMARIACMLAAIASVSGCSARWAVTPPTVADLQQTLRVARERQARFDKVYKKPDAYSRRQRTDAFLDLPPIPIPKECLPDGSETRPDCIRYAAQLRVMLFYGGENAPLYVPYSY